MMQVIISAPKSEDLEQLAAGTCANWAKRFGWKAESIKAEFNLEHTQVKFKIEDNGVAADIKEHFYSYKSHAMRRFLNARGVNYVLIE